MKNAGQLITLAESVPGHSLLLISLRAGYIAVAKAIRTLAKY